MTSPSLIRSTIFSTSVCHVLTCHAAPLQLLCLRERHECPHTWRAVFDAYRPRKMCQGYPRTQGRLDRHEGLFLHGGCRSRSSAYDGILLFIPTFPNLSPTFTADADLPPRVAALCYRSRTKRSRNSSAATAALHSIQ